MRPENASSKMPCKNGVNQILIFLSSQNSNMVKVIGDYDFRFV